MAVDLTGASGVYLTLSRNTRNFTTFNLADPSFEIAQFEQFVAMGQDNASLAFLRFPDILPIEDRLETDEMGVCGMTEGGHVITPRHGQSGYELTRGVEFGDIVISAPLSIRAEYNTVTVKATPNVAPEQDIFYSLNKAQSDDTVTIVSRAVIDIASVS